MNDVGVDRTMIDFLLGLTFAGLAVRGWLRGLVRELVDLAGLVVGLLVAFRLGASIGDDLAAGFGMTPEAAAVTAGLAIFILVGVGAAVLGHYLQRAARLPGLTMVNRLLGSALAVVWGGFVLILAVSLVRLVPAAGPLEAAVDDSRIVQLVASPGAGPQRAFHRLSGDRVIEALSNLDELLLARRMVVEGAERVELPATAASELRRDRQAARQLFDLINRARIEADLDPLAWSPALADIAHAHGREMYRQGYFAHRSPRTGTAADRVAAAGLRVRVVGENLALAATARAVHEGLMDSPGHRANILGEQYRRVGVGVVQGPLGLMVVELFTSG